MNVFDFDNTLYRGESSVDLALYMVKTNKKIILYLPKIFYNLLKYKLCIVDKRKTVAAINDFMRHALSGKEELLGAVEGFWATHRHKLNMDMLKLIGSDDVIITAGPDFLIKAIQNELHTTHLLCSVIDTDRMAVRYLNFGSNKANAFRNTFGSRKIDCFYTDSYNDKALMDIADKVYIVRNGVPRLLRRNERPCRQEQ